MARPWIISDHEFFSLGISPGEIVADEKERLAQCDRKCIREAVAEVERRGVTPSAVVPVGLTGELRMFGGDDPDCDRSDTLARETGLLLFVFG